MKPPAPIKRIDQYGITFEGDKVIVLTWKHGVAFALIVALMTVWLANA